MFCNQAAAFRKVQKHRATAFLWSNIDKRNKCFKLFQSNFVLVHKDLGSHIHTVTENLLCKIKQAFFNETKSPHCNG